MAAATPQRALAFAPIYTASSWPTLIEATAKAAHDRNGDLDLGDGRAIPRLTNRDALSLIIGWRNAAAPVAGAFGLWGAYAAAAYGWEKDSDQLDASPDRAAEGYPDTPSLWVQLADVAKTLESAQRHNPAVSTADVWEDPQTIADVARALADDNAQAAVKVPVPVACRDTKTGELRFPRPKRQPDGTIRDPDCKPVLVDDPITAVLKSLRNLLVRVAKPALVVGGIYVGLTVLDKRRARRGKRPLLGGIVAAPARRKRGKRRRGKVQHRQVVA